MDEEDKVEQIIDEDEIRESVDYGNVYHNEQDSDKPIQFLKEVIRKKLNDKTANLNEDELGTARLPVRTNLGMASYCTFMGMGSFAKVFEDDAQIIAGTSLSREGFIDKLAVTQKKESNTIFKRSPVVAKEE